MIGDETIILELRAVFAPGQVPGPFACRVAGDW
jgi:hypothetical protein